MPLMMIEAEALQRVLGVLERNVSLDGLRSRDRNPVTGLTVLVQEAMDRNSDVSLPERTVQIAGCLHCHVLNDLTHCRECGERLDEEPMVVTEATVNEAAARWQQVQEERRLEAERQRIAERQRRRDETRREQVRAFERRLHVMAPIARDRGRGDTVPVPCELGWFGCNTCLDRLRQWIYREDSFQRLDLIRECAHAAVYGGICDICGADVRSTGVVEMGRTVYETDPDYLRCFERDLEMTPAPTSDDQTHVSYTDVAPEPRLRFAY